MNSYFRVLEKGSVTPYELDSDEHQEVMKGLDNIRELDWNEIVSSVRARLWVWVELLDGDSNNVLCRVEAGQGDSVVIHISGSYDMPFSKSIWQETENDG